jgi:RimJ/RimL family protein N-acetyltransferase
MKKKFKLLAGTSEAGGADCLFPVLELLKKEKTQLFTVVGRNSAVVFAHKRFKPDYELRESDCFNSCRILFDKFKPDIALTGLLGEKTNIDYSLIRLAKEKGVPVLSILDSWMNYSDRINDPATNNRLGLLPDKIAVMDKIALDEMVNEGIPRTSCFITGHPRFDSLNEIRKKRQKKSLRESLRRKYGIKTDEITILFYAHPVNKFYPDKILGYDERDVFPIFFKAVDKLRQELPVKVIFKEHPRGRADFIASKRIPGVTFLDKANTDELLIISDFAVSMTSTMLVFSAALGIPVFSLQPNLKWGKDLNILTRRGGFPVINSVEQLYLCFLKGISANFKCNPPDWFLLDGNVCKRIYNLVSGSVKGEDEMKNKMLHPFLVGKKCYLRGIELSDLKGNYFQWFNDQETTRFMKNGSFPNSEARMKDFFERMTISDKDIVLAIVDKSNNYHIGNIGLHNIDWFYRKAELGIIIGERSYHGKGFAVEAVRLLLEHAFSRLNLHKIYLRTEEENLSAIRAFEKSGFKKEGLIRQECFREGKFTNSVYMGCLADEFIK